MNTILPLHVQETGKGDEAFVLLHGFGGSSFTWHKWLPALEEKGRVFQVDLKGFGRAPKPDDGLYSPDDQARLITRLIHDRDLRRVTLIGHSFGGGVALLTALALRDAGEGRLSRLVLIAAASYKQDLPPFVWLSRHPRLATSLLRLLGVRRVIRVAIRAIVYDKGSVSEEQVTAYSYALRSAEGVRAAMAVGRQILPSNIEETSARFAEIDVPTLLLWGDSDRVIPLRIARRLESEMPDARLVILEKCGHIPPEELPAKSWEAVDEFLESHPHSREP